MFLRNKTRENLEQTASGIVELNVAQRRGAVAAIMYAADVETIYPWTDLLSSSLDPQASGIIGTFNKYGLSFRVRNYSISWRRLIFPVTARYVNETLFAMTLLGYLVTGMVHSFDEIDVKILVLIHNNSSILPIATGDFYEALSIQLPKEINRTLFMKRLVNLSNYRAISIENDQLRIKEDLIQLDQKIFDQS